MTSGMSCVICIPQHRYLAGTGALVIPEVNFLLVPGVLSSALR